MPGTYLFTNEAILNLTEPGEEKRHIEVEKAVSEKVKLLGEGEI